MSGSTTCIETLLNSYYCFKQDSTLKAYIDRKRNSIREYYKLSEILTFIKCIVRDNDMYYINNPSIVICDAELEAALGVPHWHVFEIRGLVIKHLLRLTAEHQAAVAVQYRHSQPVTDTGSSHKDTTSGKDPAVYYKIKIDNKIPLGLFYEDNSMFELAPGLRKVLETLPSFDASKVTFRFSKIIDWVEEYIKLKKEIFFHVNTPQLACIRGDILAEALDLDYLHRSSINWVVRQNIFFAAPIEATTSVSK